MNSVRCGMVLLRWSKADRKKEWTRGPRFLQEFHHLVSDAMGVVTVFTNFCLGCHVIHYREAPIK